MFNLNKSINEWKNSLVETNTFTKDDIDELETHLLDKIHELKANNYSDKEAFKLAVEKLGSNMLLVNEFEKINLSLPKKIFLGIFGYLFLNCLYQFILFITSCIMYPIKNILDPNVNIPIVIDLIELFYGTSSIDASAQMAFLITIVLSLFSAYFLLISKHNILLYFSNKLMNLNINNLSSKVLTVTLPLLLFITKNIFSIICTTLPALNNYTSLLNPISFFNTLMILGFLVSLLKNTSNNQKLYLLGGNAIIVVVSLIASQIATTIIALNISSSSFVASIFYLFVYAIFISIIILMKNIHNKKVIFSVMSIIILLYLFSPIYPTAIYDNLMVETIGQTIYITNILNVILVLVSSFIASYLLIKDNVKKFKLI